MSAAEEPLATVDELVALAAHPKFVGIGETGLDYHYTAESAEVQQESLRIHIEAARETGLPLIIHARDADDDMARDPDRGTPRRRLYLRHALLLLRRRAGARRRSTSASTCRCPASRPSRNRPICATIFAAAPLDRILVETDSPYLAPPPHRGKRNEPAYTALHRRASAPRSSASTTPISPRRHQRQFRPAVRQGRRLDKAA